MLGWLKIKANRMTAVMALLHECWPDLCLRSHMWAKSSSMLHSLARISKSFLNTLCNAVVHWVQYVPLTHVEYDFLCISMGRGSLPWGCGAGTWVCSVPCLAIPWGFMASYVANPYALRFITLKVEIICTSEQHCMDKSINHEITDGRCKRNEKA